MSLEINNHSARSEPYIYRDAPSHEKERALHGKWDLGASSFCVDHRISFDSESYGGKRNRNRAEDEREGR